MSTGPGPLRCAALWATAALLVDCGLPQVTLEGMACDAQHACIAEHTCIVNQCRVALVPSALVLDRETLAPGETVAGSVTYTNPGTLSLEVKDIVIAVRVPGANPDQGPFDDDMEPEKTNSTLGPGESVTLNAHRQMAADAPTGRWMTYPTWVDSADDYHDGPFYYFTVSR